jgi:tetratricopeptide (TPR) repeat protein
MPVKTLGWVLVLAYATAAGAQSATIEFDVTGEHRLTTGDTGESARQLALVDARRKAWETAFLRLQDRSDVKALRLTQDQIEAFVPIVLEIREEHGQNSDNARAVQVRLHGRMNVGDVTRRMAGLRNDQDASFDLVEAWTETQQVHRQLANQTQLRAGMPNDKASAVVDDQLETIVMLDAKHTAALASAALARTEPSAIGGRTPSDEGRERALELAESALSLSPDSPDAHDVMGDILVDALEPEAAEAEFRKALSVRAGSSSGRTKLAEALRLQGKFDEAVMELREVVRAEPGFARAHSGLGLALRAQSKLPEAVAAYEEAIRLDPDLVDARNGIAVALANQGRLEDAVAQFREIIRVDPDSTIGYYNLAYALADLDRDVESAAALREVIRINPNHYNAHYNLGELFRLEGKYDESAKRFREYLRLAPDTPQNQRNIERARGFVQKFEDPQEP